MASFSDFDTLPYMKYGMTINTLRFLKNIYYYDVNEYFV